MLFSSVASVLGSPGQGELRGRQCVPRRAGPRAARARACRRRRSIGARGPMPGMAAEAGRGEAVKSRGMDLIPPDAGLELLGQAAAADVAASGRDGCPLGRHAASCSARGGRRCWPTSPPKCKAAGGRSAGSRVDHAFRKELVAADGDDAAVAGARLHPAGAGPHHGRRSRTAWKPISRSAPSVSIRCWRWSSRTTSKAGSISRCRWPS